MRRSDGHRSVLTANRRMVGELLVEPLVSPFEDWTLKGESRHQFYGLEVVIVVVVVNIIIFYHHHHYRTFVPTTRKIATAVQRRA